MMTPILLTLAGYAALAPTRLATAPALPAPALLFQQKKVELNVTLAGQPLADRQAVAGEITFVVKVVARDTVSNVEFYVGEDIRDTDGSTPYEFKIDTLAEKDGPLQVTFIAYTGEGDQGKRTVTVLVDNGTSKGAAWNVERGNEALAVSRWDDAIRFGRVAMKADPNYNPARLMMARAFKGKGVLDQAQRYAEDAVTADKNYLEAADFLSAINLEKAFTTFNRGGERSETLATIRAALLRAVESRRRVLDTMLERMGPVTDANRLAYADLAIKAGRYSLAISALADPYRRDASNSALANRIAYAQIRSGRIDEAALTLQENQRMNGVDGFGYALQAIVHSFKGNNQGADDAMKEAILNDPDSLATQTAQAFVALKRNRIDVLRTLISRLAKDQGQRTEVNYYLATVYNASQRYAEAARAFERSVLAEPTNYDMYVQRGNEALSIVASGRVQDSERVYQVQVARTFYDTALAAKPESAEALTAIAITSVYSGKVAEGAAFARAAAMASSGYAPGFFAKAMADSMMEADLRSRADALRRAAPGGVLTDDDRKRVDQLLAESNNYGKSAVEAMNTAMKLDDANLSGRKIPTKEEVFAYFIRHYRLPLLVPPK